VDLAPVHADHPRRSKPDVIALHDLKSLPPVPDGRRLRFEVPFWYLSKGVFVRACRSPVDHPGKNYDAGFEKKTFFSFCFFFE
jgi:hypothetical protein